MEETTNYAFIKHDKTEFFTVDHANENLDLIDTELKKTNDKVKNISVGNDDKPAFDYLTVGSRTDGSTVGINSSALGSKTIASGEFSHSEGNGSIATGYQSHAEGYQTKAHANSGHAEGISTQAGGSSTDGNMGAHAHAEGNSTKALGTDSHAEGSSSFAGSSNSHAEGYITTVATGTIYKITTYNNTNKTIILDNVTGLAVGDTLVIKKDETIALENIPITNISGLVVTLNTSETISSNWMYVIKKLVDAGNYSGHAEGGNTIVAGTNGHAEGSRSIASGVTSHAEGSSTIASGRNSHAEGEATQANNLDSHAEGRETIANGGYSHAEGYLCKAYSTSSHAEGLLTQAGGSSTDPLAGEYAHAEGSETKATGVCSHTEGVRTNATGYGSHAGGYETSATGTYSHSGGNTTIAKAPNSFVHGYYAEAWGNEQAVFGRYNAPNNTDLFQIGGGTSDAARKNVFRVTSDGKAISGSDVPRTPLTLQNITAGTAFYCIRNGICFIELLGVVFNTNNASALLLSSGVLPLPEISFHTPVTEAYNIINIGHIYIDVGTTQLRVNTTTSATTYSTFTSISYPIANWN